MKPYFRILSILLLLIWISCSKENDSSGNNEENTTDPISNLSESPGLLLGSWNLTKKNTPQNSGRNDQDCQATNIHFLENNIFYLKYLNKRIKGKYEVTGTNTINLLNGTEVVGTITQIEVIENEITLLIEITSECTGNYTGNKYFRIHQFVWEAMNDFYLWQEDVPSLSDDVKPIGSPRYNELIEPYPEPEAFFESLKHEEDKFSQIRSDYQDLENSIRGIDASNGVEFILSRYGSGNGVFGVVSYILEGSDASEKDIQRGDIFTGVNGQSLNLDNYRELLFNDNLDYTLNMAQINNNVISLNGKNISLTKTENFQSNPIQISKIIAVGDTKVGYLMYNQFALGFDDELNEVFANFQAQGINELIIDLRYNGGGLVQSAINLAGMITGQFNGEIFGKYLWNSKVMKALNSDPERYAGSLIVNFTNQLKEGEAINSLNFNKVYVITTGRSASASELLINGLAPYINVVQVGDNTYGKNVGGQAAIYDKIDNQGKINPDHTYALYCMSFYIANNVDFYDYADGLAPQADLLLKEDLTNMGTLGENSDPLLALALKHITQESARYQIKTPVFPLENTVDDPQFMRELSITTIAPLPLLQLD